MQVIMRFMAEFPKFIRS